MMHCTNNVRRIHKDDLPPQVAERAAKFSTTMADDLRGAVGGQRYGGVLTFDVRDLM